MAAFLLEIFLYFLIYVVGYTIACSIFPWISSGQIVVQPYSGEFFPGYYRRDDLGRTEIASEAAAWLGFLILLAMFTASYVLMILMRAVF
jgi:hypothetical protein